MEMPAATDTPNRRGGAVMSTISTPLPSLDAGTLNALVRVFLDSAIAPESVTLDGGAFGDFHEGEPVEHIVRERDLFFVHSLDASRFGSSPDECEICSRRRG